MSRRISRARLKLGAGEALLVSLLREKYRPIDVFIDPERGDDKTGDGSGAKPFKSIKALERLWPKRVLP